MKNSLKIAGVCKRLVRLFRSQEFWECIGCVVLAVTYGKKGHNLWIEVSKSFGNKSPTKLQIDVYGNTNLYKVVF